MNGPGVLVAPRQLVAGRWSDPMRRGAEPLHDCATGDVTQAPVATDADAITAAIDDAWRAHLASAARPADRTRRAEALHAAADQLSDLTEQIAVQDALDSGVPIAVTRLFARSLPDSFTAAARQMMSTETVDLTQDQRPVFLSREPLGPSVVLAPWNAPTAVAAKKAAYAWAAGCPVIIKPSPFSPHGTTLLVEAMQRAAAETGLDRASVQLVFGGASVGQHLVADPRIRAITFTGSRSGGRATATTAAPGLAALQLELGSNNPAVVLPDADVQKAARELANGAIKLNGAWCESPGTVFVPREMRDSLVDALRGALGEARFGHPLDESATLGPQANLVQFHSLKHRVRDFAASGARVLQLGDTAGLTPGGFWFAPTLVIDPPTELARDECFGPVLVIQTYEVVEDAISRSFELETGLAGYVFGENITQAIDVGRRLPVGEVKVNGTSILDMSDRSAQQFWYGSGAGGHGDRELAEFFTGARIVGLDVDSPI